MRPCDLDCLSKLFFPQPKEALLYDILLQFAQWLLRRCLKLSFYESPGSKVKQ